MLISLVDGQSYKNITIIDPRDYETNGIPNIFEEWTFAFHCDNDKIIAHAFNIKVIHLTTARYRVPSSLKFKKLVMIGDVVYGPGTIIDQKYYEEYNIPDIFNRNFGMLKQLSFVTHQGVIITSDYNVVTLIFEDLPVKTGGVRSSVHNKTEVNEVFTNQRIRR